MDAAGAQQSFHFLGCFLNHLARLVDLESSIQREFDWRRRDAAPGLPQRRGAQPGKETALVDGLLKSGRIFHYTSINPWICSAIKCAGYDSRKVESDNATMDGGWGKVPILGHARIHYEAAHLCAEEPHL